MLGLKLKHVSGPYYLIMFLYWGHLLFEIAKENMVHMLLIYFLCPQKNEFALAAVVLPGILLPTWINLNPG